MRAVAVWPARSRIDVVERVAPTIDSDTSVRLRVLGVGVCGTDAEICRFDYPMEQFSERAGDSHGIKDVITVAEAK